VTGVLCDAAFYAVTLDTRFSAGDEGEDAGGQRARCAELCEHAPAQAEPPVVAQQVDKVEQRVETPASGSRGNLCLVRTTAYITSK